MPNFNLVFGGVINNLKSIRSPSKLLRDILIKADELSLSSQNVNTLTIIPDLPIIKVLPLTPRIKEEFLTGFKVKKSDDLATLKKK